MKTNEKINGFSLAEVAIVLLIGSLLLAGASNALTTYLKQGRINTTTERLDLINAAIQQYLNVNKKLPCPAPFDAPPDTDKFGIEVNPTDCRTAAYAGTFRVGGAGSEIRIGAVPVRSLNLPDQFVADGWKARYTYAVTEALASEGTFQQAGGKIAVVDSKDNTVVSPAGSAQYVIISHGANKSGAYDISGTDLGSCTAGTLEAINCNHSSEIFRKTILIAEADGANYFDDYLYAQNATADQFSMPVGSVVAFDLPACPLGWQDYSASVGRTIIGAGIFPSESYTVNGRPWSSQTVDYVLGVPGGYQTWVIGIDELPSHRHKVIGPAGGEARYTYFNPTTYDASKPKLAGINESTIDPVVMLENTGGDIPHSNMPPYLPLRYCKKI
ncbi:MAG TPA: prepilin-type N-terminal cleavage/methylation domain-containing protein [Micavibrio sp.]|nr:prepilin-type N-terminal cleavage/methylation domain-containing protein [Micavibrio sp.]